MMFDQKGETGRVFVSRALDVWSHECSCRNIENLIGADDEYLHS